ncbi:hypothetical protein [Parasitella parasitica]|uniref:Uncharacterized protein n=1 Tax=Parasitella parasitica TaxID=35722 RepID=A0A0B7NSR7_9FUNG|nr:hypothetical protein [Parasitella parasitica]
MPEIAEVERARLRIHRQCINHKVTHVEVQPDTNVFKGISPEDFAKSIMNKTLVDTKRWGKYFILIFDEGPHIVGHLGMTGGIRFKHEELDKGLDWPPRFHKLLITFTDPDTEKQVFFGYKDPRRWSRLRLVSDDPLTSDPINKLGFDPVLALPDFETFRSMVQKRSIPVKALLLDQSFSAGVGNWVADEVLFQAMIHPAQYTNTLTEKELNDMYHKLKFVCETAVAVEADESKFPDDWLMKHRWNKGKTNENKGKLPNGLLLQFETVAGRTSAFAPARQILRLSEENKKVSVKRKRTVEAKIQDSIGDDGQATNMADVHSVSSLREKKIKNKKKLYAEAEAKQENDDDEEEVTLNVESIEHFFNPALPPFSRPTIYMQKELVALAAGIIVSHYILKRKRGRKHILKPHDERVVILGCSSGIGKECALSYASRGAKLVLFARRKELLDQLKQQCQNAGSPQVELLAGDVTVEDDLNKLADFTKDTLGDVVDTVIYCAGMISVRPFLDACGIEITKESAGQQRYTVQDNDTGQQLTKALQKITTINYFSSVWTARLFLPLLLNSISPNFIVVSSMAGKAGAPTRGLYAGSKHALHGFFDSIRVELVPYNIHIGLICPGTVDTELRQSAVDKSLGGQASTEIAGSKKNKLSPSSVARRIIQASDMREREVYIPAWFGYVAMWAKLIASPLVDYAAARNESSSRSNELVAPNANHPIRLPELYTSINNSPAGSQQNSRSPSPSSSSLFRPSPLDHRPDLTGRQTWKRRESLPSIAYITHQQQPTEDPMVRRHSIATRTSTPSSSLQQERRHCTNGSYSRSPELRISHKLAERKRRKEMKDLFDDLRELLPMDKSLKSSKWEILSKAVEYIDRLREKEVRALHEKEELQRELSRLKESSSSSSFH